MKKLLLPLLALALVACDNNGNSNSGPLGKDVAVIAARTPDYSAGAISLVDTEAPYAAQNNLNATVSDIVVRSGGDHFFRVEGFFTDRITRYDAQDPDTQVWQYSTQGAGETASSNPYDIIIASPTKAYVLRYGSGKLWIVNPSATTEAAFKIGEIDLSAYDVDGVPQMAAGIIRNGRLYVAMQRLEGAFLDAVKSGYVAVIDVNTDAEITTGSTGAALKGIELPMRNPSGIAATPSGDIIVTATGDYAGGVNGGIARINPTTYATTLIVDDGTPGAAPYGQITHMAVVDNSRGYFVGSTSFFGPKALYRFSPTGTPAPTVVTGFTAGQYGALGVSPSNQLFISLIDDLAPGVAILDVSGATETVQSARVDTALTPINIDFIVVE